jgi:5'-deoxynucleotidase YfbR-like HD superfamily hydrolase
MTAETSNRYLSPKLSSEQNDKYQGCLGKVIRWRTENGLLSTYPESDLEHVDDMINIISEIEHRFPNLANAVNLEITREIIYFHDGGEILAGDVLAGINNRLTDEQIKRDREQRAVNALTSKRYIKDEELGQSIRDIYARYDNCRPEGGAELNDREALLTHLIDKVQAVRFGIANVVKQKSGQEDGLCFSPKLCRQNILKFTLPLLDALPTTASKRELISFLSEEFKCFKENGFADVYDEGLKQLQDYAINHVLN